MFSVTLSHSPCTDTANHSKTMQTCGRRHLLRRRCLAFHNNVTARHFARDLFLPQAVMNRTDGSYSTGRAGVPGIPPVAGSLEETRAAFDHCRVLMTALQVGSLLLAAWHHLQLARCAQYK